jgi:putative FmdB family regulatory protein
MPIYSFVCEICGERFDRFLHFSDDSNDMRCPNGHEKVRRVYTPPTVVYKGKGFYITDNRSPGSPKASDD